MAYTDQQRRELDELIFALRDQALEWEGHARLERLVLEHAEAREQFVTAMHLQAALHWRYAGDAATGLAATPSTSAAIPVVAPVLVVSERTSYLPLFVAAVSLLLVFSGAVVWNLRQLPDDPRVAARVTKLAHVVWSGAALEEGATLDVGRRLEPIEGIVELTFISGARVTIEGPAEFEVLSAIRGRLQSGVVTVKAPPELKGFTVETPSLTVTDLGTEFGVQAQQAGPSQVHVFDGLVEAAAVRDASHPVLLSERQAIQCDLRTGVLDDVVYDEERFVRDAAARPAARQIAEGFAESFDDPASLQLQRGYRVETMETSRADDRHEGAGSLQTNWRSGPGGYGVMYLARKVPITDVAGCNFEVWVKPFTKNSGYWGIELFDERGEMVEQHRVFQLTTDQWNKLVFSQGKQTPGGYLAVGRGNIRRVAKVVFRAQTHEGGQTAGDLWDDFQLLHPE